MSGPPAAEVAALLSLSRERDEWELVRTARERAAFVRGRKLGRREGYEAAEADMAARWNRIARPVVRNDPEHAELELRRWGPAGREHFGDPRPGDFPGRKTARAA